MFYVCHCLIGSLQPYMSCLEQSDLVSILCAVLSCVFVNFPYDTPGKVRYLIVLIPDLCLPLYLNWQIVHI